MQVYICVDLFFHPVSAIDAGHSAHASSSSRGFDFSAEHPLVRTILDDDTVSWEDLDMRFQTAVDDIYTLGDLLDKVDFSRSKCDDISGNFAATPNAMRSNSHHAIAWVKHLIDDTLHPDFQLTYTSDIVISALQEGLVPFRCSLKNQPDGVVLCEYQRWKLPLFCLEVHSSPYRNSVSKTAVDVLDQFRLLRCFNPDIPECVGFTFPKYSDKTFVTKVKVSFEKFTFAVRLFPLAIDNVKAEVTNALRSALSFEFSSPQFCFMRFSRKDIDNVQNELRVMVAQHPTRHSVLLKSDKFFWKCVPRQHDQYNIYVLNLHKSGNMKHITFHCDVKPLGRVLFYKFPAHLPPLHKHEVEKCLLDFMTRTATALEELHGIGFAHLDVRVPNICFAKEGSKYIVKLIDLDRCRGDTADNLYGYTGEMYRRQKGWRSSQYDWKQLGLLAAAIIFKCSHEDIVKGPKVRGDVCLNHLIHEGKCYLCRAV